MLAEAGFVDAEDPRLDGVSHFFVYPGGTGVGEEGVDGRSGRGRAVDPALTTPCQGVRGRRDLRKYCWTQIRYLLCSFLN